MVKIVDGSNAVFGRLASQVAKMLLNGEKVVLINAEKILITGNGKEIVEKFKTRRSLQHKATPEYSPKWPRVPHLLVKRMIRGMLPYKKARGRQAFKNLRVYSGKPEGLEGEEIQLPEVVKPIKKGITVAELCKQLGWNK